jgi:two-component system response regulator YesN
MLMKLIHNLLQAEKNSAGEWLLTENSLRNNRSFEEQVENYLRKNVNKFLTTADVANHMNVSESTLNHKYKKATGCSPIAKHTEIRMEFVKGLLLKGERLKVIAEMMEFCDEYYVSKAFKKATGFSPRQFVLASRSAHLSH